MSNAQIIYPTIGIDHRGNIAGGFNRQSVNWQLHNQRRMQDNHTRQVQESFSSNPISLIRRANPSHVYWKELEALPRKVKLKKELQTLFKPESKYSYSAHNYRSSPWLQIYDARHMEIDTTQYQTNRTYYSKLYKSMKTAGIQHQDILSIWGNPYIGTVTKWNELSYQRKQSLKLQYPEMEKLAESIEEQRRDFYDKVWWNISEPAKRFLDEYAFAISAIASTNPYGRAAVGLVRTGQAIVNVVPKLGKLITTIGSVELARQFQILYKKNSGDGSNQRLGTSGFKEGKYWGGLTDNANGLKNLGVKPKKIDEILGNIRKLKKYENGEIRADKFGNLYKFDPAHKSSKIHLEKIEKRSDGFWNTAEVSHETGEILKPLKRWIGK